MARIFNFADAAQARLERAVAWQDACAAELVLLAMWPEEAVDAAREASSLYAGSRPSDAARMLLDARGWYSHRRLPDDD